MLSLPAAPHPHRRCAPVPRPVPHGPAPIAHRLPEPHDTPVLPPVPVPAGRTDRRPSRFPEPVAEAPSMPAASAAPAPFQKLPAGNPPRCSHALHASAAPAYPPPHDPDRGSVSPAQHSSAALRTPALHYPVVEESAFDPAPSPRHQCLCGGPAPAPD